MEKRKRSRRQLVQAIVILTLVALLVACGGTMPAGDAEQSAPPLEAGGAGEASTTVPPVGTTGDAGQGGSAEGTASGEGSGAAAEGSIIVPPVA